MIGTYDKSKAGGIITLPIVDFGSGNDCDITINVVMPNSLTVTAVNSHITLAA